jgi:predicted MFS family arabinose efflux permease
MFAMGTDNFVVAGILPDVAASLHTSVSLAGLMVTFYALTYAVAAPVMAAVAGGWPRKLLLVSALCIFVAGNAISALATDLHWVLLSRVMAGFGAALFSPTALGVAAALATPEKRGRALSTVTVGLTGATALGSPIGTFIGGFGSWRTTLWFVAMLGIVAMIGVWTLLPSVARPATVKLRERLVPVRDVRIALTLLTSLFAFGGFLMVYTYAGVVLARVTHGDERILAGMLLLWGVAATVGNVLSGRLVDRFESRSIINAMLWLAIINFGALPWTSAHALSALTALCIWGICGWGLIVPQQHRLVQITPKAAPLLLALNNTATYVGLAGSSVVGGTVLQSLGVRYLGIVAAGLIALAFILAEAAHRCIERPVSGIGQRPVVKPRPSEFLRRPVFSVDRMNRLARTVKQGERDDKTSRPNTSRTGRHQSLGER